VRQLQRVDEAPNVRWRGSDFRWQRVGIKAMSVLPYLLLTFIGFAAGYGVGLFIDNWHRKIGERLP